MRCFGEMHIRVRGSGRQGGNKFLGWAGEKVYARGDGGISI